MTNFFLNRRGESGSVPFRSGRFYSVGTEWYFAVRRGADQGPYDNKDQAKDALVTFINDQLAFEKHLEKNKVGLTIQNGY